MARKSNSISGNEPDGATDEPSSVDSGGDIFGSEQPLSAVGGDGSGDGGSDQYQRNSDGSIKRNADGTPRKRRRKRGSVSGPRSSSDKSQGQLSVDSIEGALVGIHSMLALIGKAPEMMLETDESKPYAVAVCEVAKLYDIPNVTKEAIAWTGLIIMLGKIYIPRMAMINERHKAEKAKRVPEETGMVPFNGDIGSQMFGVGGAAN